MHVLGSILFFWGGGEFFDLGYKTEHTSDHVAKFQGVLPRELGDLALKIEKKQQQSIRPLAPND